MEGEKRTADNVGGFAAPVELQGTQKRVPDLVYGDIPGLSKVNTRVLVEVDLRLKENGLAGGVLEYLKNSKKGYRVIGEELGIYRRALPKIFEYYGIPELSRSESVRGTLQSPEAKRRRAEKLAAKPREPKTVLPKNTESISERMKRLWKDPEYRKMIMAAREKIKNDPERLARLKELQRQLMLQKRQDPLFVARAKEGAAKAQSRPDLRQKKSEALKRAWKEASPEKREKWSVFRRLWQDPEFREKRSKKIKELLADEEYQQKRKAALRAKWADPEWRDKKIKGAREVLTRLNQTTDQLENAAKGLRQLRADPSSTERFHLNTIQGYRKDIGYVAQSAWEANVARIFILTGREFYPNESVILNVPETYKHLFKYEITQLTIDFIVSEKDGELVAYDLVAHPLEDPVGLAKADMFRQQNPNVKYVVIDANEYSRLKAEYSDLVNSSPSLCGWETHEDNLRTNPSKFG